MITQVLNKLIFVYNSDSGFRNAIMDSVHKIFSPSTYVCSLCDITFGVFAEDTVWREFRKSSPLEMEFLHKDEFAQNYASKLVCKFTFPLVLLESEKGLEVFIKTQELDKLHSSKDLMSLINNLL